MDKPVYGVVLFNSTQAAIKAEKILKREKIKIKLIPVPRQFSTDCGICLRFEFALATRITSILTANRVEIAAFHRL